MVPTYPVITPVYQFHAYDQELLVYNYSLDPDAGTSQGWTRDGVAFFGLGKAEPGAVPVYSYYAKGNVWKTHLSLTDTSPGTDWVRFGIAFFAYPLDKEVSLPVYELGTKDYRYYYSLSPDSPEQAFTFNQISFHVFAGYPG